MPDPVVTPAAEPTVTPEPAPAAQMSAEELTEFNAWKASKQAAPPAPTKTAFELMREEQQKEKDGVNAEKQMRLDVAFDMGFDTLIEDSGLFDMKVERMRKMSNGLDGAEKVHMMKYAAVTDFFNKSSHLDLLLPVDQDYIKSNVIDCNEKNIDTMKAWAILEQALHTSRRVNLNNNQRLGGDQRLGGGDSPHTPMLNAFIEKAKNKMRGIKPLTT